MRTWIAFVVVGLSTVSAAAAAVVGWTRVPRAPLPRVCERPKFSRTFDVASFLKGNLHAHTSRSDGDSPPEDVIGWYRRAGYAFLAVTDHNRFTDPARFGWIEDGSFQVLPGEEITMIAAGRQVHVNGICTKQRIAGGSFATAGKALEYAVDQVERQGGVSIVNHPNFDHGIPLKDLAAARGAPLLEIMSGHPYVYSEGTSSRPSAEAIWDASLDRDLGFMAVAVDDEHRLRVDGDPPAYPGRAWVEVFGASNDRDSVCNALRAGRLYATTGALLRRIAVTENTYSVWPANPAAAVSFIGGGGRELWRAVPTDSDGAVSYRLSGDETYVRARVLLPDGSRAWTPAVSVSVPSDENRCDGVTHAMQ